MRNSSIRAELERKSSAKRIRAELELLTSLRRSPHEIMKLKLRNTLIVFIEYERASRTYPSFEHQYRVFAAGSFALHTEFPLPSPAPSFIEGCTRFNESGDSGTRNPSESILFFGSHKIAWKSGSTRVSIFCRWNQYMYDEVNPPRTRHEASLFDGAPLS